MKEKLAAVCVCVCVSVHTHTYTHTHTHTRTYTHTDIHFPVDRKASLLASLSPLRKGKADTRKDNERSHPQPPADVWVQLVVAACECVSRPLGSVAFTRPLRALSLFPPLSLSLSLSLVSFSFSFSLPVCLSIRVSFLGVGLVFFFKPASVPFVSKRAVCQCRCVTVRGVVPLLGVSLSLSLLSVSLSLCVFVGLCGSLP